MKLRAWASWISGRPGTPARQLWYLLALWMAIALSSYAVFLRYLPAPWQPSQSSDYRVFYEPVARQLVEGRGFYLPSGEPALKYPPGIPIAFGVSFLLADRLGLSHETAVIVLQALLTVLAGILIGVLALRCCGARVAVVACFLWSTYPFHLWLTKQSSGETIVSVFLLLAALAFVQWLESGRRSFVWGTVCGMALALAALTKPFTIALPVVFLFLTWICSVPCKRRKRAFFSFFMFLAFALSVSPWEVWAWRITGQVIPLSINGPASVADGLTFGTRRQKVRPRAQLPPTVAALAADMAAHRQALKTTGGIARLLAANVKKDPIVVARLFLVKAVQSWYSNDSHTHEKWAALLQLFYLPLFIAGAWLARLRNRRENNFFLISSGVLLYYWAMTTLAAPGILRYMVPAIGLVMVLAADAAYSFGSAIAWHLGLPSRYAPVYAEPFSPTLEFPTADRPPE